MTETTTAREPYWVRLEPEVGEFGYERERLDGSSFRSAVVRVYDDRGSDGPIHVQFRSLGREPKSTTLVFDSLAGFSELLGDLTEAAHSMAAKAETPMLDGVVDPSPTVSASSPSVSDDSSDNDLPAL
jgi:hypothetical protein